MFTNTNRKILLLTVGMKNVTGKLHFWWTQRIIRREGQTSREYASFKTGVFRSPVNGEHGMSII
jgi:hypothetical protein